MLDLTAVTPALRPGRVEYAADQLCRRKLAGLLDHPGATWTIPEMDPPVTVVAAHLPGPAVAAAARQSDGRVWLVLDPDAPAVCAQARAMLADVVASIPDPEAGALSPVA